VDERVVVVEEKQERVDDEMKMILNGLGLVGMCFFRGKNRTKERLE